MLTIMHDYKSMIHHPQMPSKAWEEERMKIPMREWQCWKGPPWGWKELTGVIHRIIISRLPSIYRLFSTCRKWSPHCCTLMTNSCLIMANDFEICNRKNNIAQIIFTIVFMTLLLRQPFTPVLKKHISDQIKILIFKVWKFPTMILWI